MIINAGLIGLSALHMKWTSKRYEQSRWLIFTALIGLALQYYLQLVFGLRAAGDDIGAAVNMFIYTPCFTLISMGIYNIETTFHNLKKMEWTCGILYAAIIATFIIGAKLSGSYHIGGWIYVMELFYGTSVVYCIYMIIREMIKRKKLLETMVATDILPYLRYSRASVIILFLAALVMPFAILSTKLLIIVGPLVLLGVFFFNLTFVALGFNYTPTEELLDEEEEMEAKKQATTKHINSASDNIDDNNSIITNEATISEKKIDEIRTKLNEWCEKRGFKDCSVNMLTLSRSLEISKDELTQYFDKHLHSTFRIWLSDIRFEAVKEMMKDFPEYSNDIISVECGFSSRTSLYRVFKIRENCTPIAWRTKHTGGNCTE